MAISKMGPSIQIGVIPNIKACPGGLCFFSAEAYPVATCPECGVEYCTIKCPIEKGPAENPCRLQRPATGGAISCARCRGDNGS